jgi:hypothetical protein
MSGARVLSRYTIFSVAPKANLGEFKREFREYLLVDEGWECEVANLIKAPPKENEGGRPMQLRHIRPGTVDWNDATNEGGEANLARLSPEEVKKLRAVMATEGLSEEEARVRTRRLPRQN